MQLDCGISSVMTKYPLFNSHLDLAKSYWKKLLKPNSIVIDATCGNGHDTLFLAEIVLRKGMLIAIDIQSEAILQTKFRIKAQIPPEIAQNVQYFNQCHSSFPAFIQEESVALIVYNLGYLPGANKDLTTEEGSTLKSLANALKLIAPGGALSVTCYPGHPAGKIEEAKVLEFASTFDPKVWNSSHTRFLNRNASPSLLIIQKLLPNNTLLGG